MLCTILSDYLETVFLKQLKPVFSPLSNFLHTVSYDNFT